MPLKPTGDLITAARAERRALAAFNVITLEHAEAIVAGAESRHSPVILQISENAVKFHHGRLAPIARATAAVAEAAGIDVALHLDHVEDPALLRQAADYGFGSVMFDGSHLDYAENVRATREAADWAHARGLWLEAELGKVGGKDGEPPLSAHAPGARTDPDEAREFVAGTGVDALAVAVGSSHAMTDRSAVLDHELIARLRAAIGVPLVLHGSSGVPDAELARAVAGGVVKVNVGTALNIAFTGAVRGWLEQAPANAVDPRKYLAPAREAMAATAAHFISVLSPDGLASDAD
ncbi:class II fructose-bisphosphate aldolase [Catenulispora sp. NL8]|uniref:Class II fructose-bisphosphate aldolase n=1 Tax=Catenulispora pinistramenti TaxID=2705254 RepID=A0ABS5L6J8_9ACTN|nr:class II fructose-bisphosphate aldolase [Catenulispora pinistramenti]MBS2553962.1 class II fructose-bisphosphate aldolase [Catenulispora pinistramenti]